MKTCHNLGISLAAYLIDHPSLNRTSERILLLSKLVAVRFA